MTNTKFAKSLGESARVCEALTTIGSELNFKKLTSRLLFESLYLMRSLEHFQSMILLFQHEQYNSALALRRVLYETYLRGMWISRYAPDEIIAAARQDNFKFPEKFEKQELQRTKLEKELSNTNAGGFDLESKFYRRGCGFVHGGLHETAIYAVRTNPRVAEHLFKTAHQELRRSTLRLIQVFLELHCNLMRAAVDAKPYGASSVDKLMARTDQLKVLAKQYCGNANGLAVS
jgi:hypothetical protein